MGFPWPRTTATTFDCLLGGQGASGSFRRHSAASPTDCAPWGSQGRERLQFFDVKYANLCRLVLADFGPAKQHEASTALRLGMTKTFVGTYRYEIPEKPSGNGPRSRLYDMWSMGCIIIEFVVWLLYGHNELRRFQDAFRSSANAPDRSESPVDAEVQRWIDYLYKDLRCGQNCPPRLAKLGSPKPTCVRFLSCKVPRSSAAAGSLQRTQSETSYLLNSCATPRVTFRYGPPDRNRRSNVNPSDVLYSPSLSGTLHIRHLLRTSRIVELGADLLIVVDEPDELVRSDSESVAVRRHSKNLIVSINHLSIKQSDSVSNIVLRVHREM